MTHFVQSLSTEIEKVLPAAEAIYKDLHSNPELSFWFIGGTALDVYDRALSEGTTAQLPGPHSPYWAPPWNAR